MRLVPVDGNPFGDDPKPYSLTPVQGNPFAEQKRDAAIKEGQAQLAAEQSPLDAMMIAAGQTATRIGKGVKQADLGIKGFLKHGLYGGGQGELDQLAQMNMQERADSARIQPVRDAQPVASFAGDVLPYLATPARLGAAGAGAASALEMGSPEERALRAGLGYGGAKAGEKIAGVVANRVKPSSLSQSQQAANEAADRLGVNLSAGEASGNRVAKWIESSTADLPVASGMATKRATNNQRAMSQAALRSIGQQGDEITPEVLSAGRQAISGEYDRILGPAKIALDKSFQAEVSAITGSKVIKELRDESVDALIEPFKNLPGKVTVTGEWFQQNKTALDKAVRSAYANGESGKAQALESFEKALDRAAMRSLSEEERTRYKAAQRKWANLRMLETGKVVDEGRVMPGRLDSALNTRYKSAYKEGKIKGELPDIARLANTLRPPPNSGSVPRSVYTGGIGGAAFVEPASALAMLGIPAGAQALMTSPMMKKYMTQGLMNLTPEMERRLLASGGYAGLLGGMAVSP